MPEKRPSIRSSSSRSSSSPRARHAMPTRRRVQKERKSPTKATPDRAFIPSVESFGSERAAMPRTVRTASLAIVLCIAIAFVLVQTATGANTDDMAAVAEDQLLASEPAFSETVLVSTAPTLAALTPALIDGIEAQKGVFGFTLTDDGVAPATEAPVLSEEHRAAIEGALAPYKNNDIDASFFLVDIATGRGMAYQLDESIYAASSFKGPYCAFLSAEYLDKGTYEVDSVIECDEESCPSGSSADGEDTVENLMAATILYSSNEAYGSLRSACSNVKLENWFESVEVSGSKAYDMRLPFFTVRDMAKMWAHVHTYLQTDSDNAAFLKDLFGKTEMSFIRDALEESATADVRVLNKGGWYRPDDTTYDAVVDCGIATCEGRDYLLCVMTGAHWNAENVTRAETLISTVFTARGDLL